jgi:hypothetical protein
MVLVVVDISCILMYRAVLCSRTPLPLPLLWGPADPESRIKVNTLHTNMKSSKQAAR